MQRGTHSDGHVYAWPASFRAGSLSGNGDATQGGIAARRDAGDARAVLPTLTTPRRAWIFAMVSRGPVAAAVHPVTHLAGSP
jgi:hypothetical protein